MLKRTPEESVVQNPSTTNNYLKTSKHLVGAQHQHCPFVAAVVGLSSTVKGFDFSMRDDEVVTPFRSTSPITIGAYSIFPPSSCVVSSFTSKGAVFFIA